MDGYSKLTGPGPVFALRGRLTGVCGFVPSSRSLGGRQKLHTRDRPEHEGGKDVDQAAARTDAFPSITPRMSLSFMIRSSSPSIFTSVPDHLPNRTRSPFFTLRGTILPLSSRAPGTKVARSFPSA